ncbi:MAG TPA: S8 family serine peptidase [Dokdonella sp.]|nr:S8 family serine peptidase [Dokdonella sp.]
MQADGVDVINYSISGGRDPWNDLDRVFLDAVNADVFVSASAGNTSASVPSVVGTVNHLGPWTMTVAASTQDELIGPQLAVTGPDPLPMPPPDLAHVPLNPGSTTVVGDTTGFIGGRLLTYPTNLVGCTTTGAFPAGYFSGAIAMVRRGSCSFTEKITNAFNAGATMVVIGNNAAGSLNMNTTGAPAVPAFSVTMDFGDALIAYAAGNNPPAPPADQIFANGFDPLPGTIADYSRAVPSARQGDVIASFSLRGPTPAIVENETKPDITGPGVDIYAALTTDEGSYGFLSGTSMSSPHVAGAAALIRAVHPDWTVPEVKSALMMTATNATGVLEDTVTPWTFDDVGSGRVDLTRAALAALTMDESYANFLAADPATMGDVRTLNLPQLRDMNCDPTCSWTRTVKNQASGSTSWEVTSVTDPSFAIAASPSTFTLAPGATQTITFTVTPNTTMSTIKFGTVTLAQPGPGVNGGPAPVYPPEIISVAVKSPAPPPVPGVCDGGVCNLQIDGLPASGGNFSALGCGATSPCQFLWLNQFTPDPAEYPITLNAVQTIFSAANTSLGDVFDVYFFQDNDTNPANGATLVGSVLNQTITVQLALQTVPVPNIVMNGPGDILVAVVNRTINANPASGDDGVPFLSHSWISNLGSIPATPDLSTLNMQLTTAVLPSFTRNWILRAQGTNAGGVPVTLEPSAD